MAKENSSRQLRQRIAQNAARLMAEEGIGDYAFAKRKAARQLGIEDTQCLPGNAEILDELRLYQEIYQADEQPQQLSLLRQDALTTMRLLEKFHPYLTGAVLDGSAGRFAETDLLLFADSDKEVEIFLLGQNIPYTTREKIHHSHGVKRKIPVFVLEGPHGTIHLNICSSDDARRPLSGSGTCADITEVETLLGNPKI